MRRQVSSAKLTNRSYASCSGLSPYEKNYKGCLRIEQRELIFEHQRVSKMTRRDLEDQYINLCDEHYAIKREHRFNQEKIKRLITKILRISSLSLSDVRANLNPNLVNRPREVLSFEEKLQICIFDLEIQNSQLNERLLALCKRHGLPPPARPASEMYTHCPQSDLHLLSHHNRARSCHHINGVGRSMDELDSHSNQVQSIAPSGSVPVKSEENNRVVEDDGKIKELEQKNEQLGRLLSEFNVQLEHERNQTKEMSYKLKELEIRKHISENIELINLKEKLDQTKGEFKKRMELLQSSKARNEEILIEERTKLVEMTHKLTQEEEKSQKVSNQLKQIEGMRKQIEDLREQLIESESEKQSLKTQQERFALLLKESVHQGDRIQILKDKNSQLMSELDEAKANEMAVMHSKSELVEKIIKIQDENDRISIELEGLKSLLAQDNEIFEDNVGGSPTESPIRLNTKTGDNVIITNANSRRGSHNAGVSKSPKLSPFKTIGVNTDPISILKYEHVNIRDGHPDQSSDGNEPSSDSLKISESENNFPCESLTLDSERSSLTNYHRTSLRTGRTFEKLKKEKKPRRDKQTNHLELLERAALYGTFAGNTDAASSSKLSFDFPDAPSSISESITIECEPSLSVKENDPAMLITLQSFKFKHAVPGPSTFHLEVTASADQSFHTPGYEVRKSGGDLEFNYRREIKLTAGLLNSLKSPETPIRFLLMERAAAEKEKLFSSTSSSIQDTCTTDIVQCRDIAYGSLKYSALLKSLTDTTSTDQPPWTVSCELPFHSTRFSHPEIGRLTLRFMIDDVARVRQLLTNTKP